MICSNCNEILKSENGYRSLNFRPPGGPKQINEALHNVVVVWDIIMQDYRNVSVDDCYLVNEMEPDEFWKYYNEKLLPMSVGEKMQYMDTP